LLDSTETQVESGKDLVVVPKDTYKVVVAHVFGGDPVFADIPVEKTLWWLLGEPNNPEGFYVEIDGTPIPTELLSETSVQAGQFVSIKQVPGDDEFLRILLQIVLIVVSIFVPPLAGFGDLATALLQGAILVGGQIAINALIPFDQPSIDGSTPSTLNNIGTTRNKLEPFGVVPRIFGKVRQWPPYAANPFTEVLGNDVWLNALFCIGEGFKFDVTDIKIGTTDITDLSDVAIQKTTAPDYPDVFQENLNIELEQAALDPNGDEAIRTTQADTTRASIDIAFPRGLAIFDSDGDRHTWRVDFSIEFRPADTSDDWQNVITLDHLAQTGGNLGTPDQPTHAFLDENGDTIFVWDRGGGAGGLGGGGGVEGSPDDLFTGPFPQPLGNIVTVSKIDPGAYFSFFRATVDAFRGSVKWTFPESGEWDIRIKRRNSYNPLDLIPRDTSFVGYTESRIADTFLWTALRSFNDNNATPVDDSGDIWYMSLRIKATDQLAGALDSFNYLVEAYTRPYDGDTWLAPTKNRSPAWAFAEVLTGKSTAAPVIDDTLIAADLLAWDTWAIANNFTFDFEFIDERSMFAVLNIICSAGRAALSQREGKFTVILDNEVTSPVQIFTRRNSSKFSGTKVFLDELHGTKVRYRSESENYQWTERIVYNDGFQESNATNLEVLELLGVVNDDQAFKMALRYMAEIIHRPEFYFLEADLENLIAQRGDTVLIQNEFMLVGIGSARVESIVGNVVTLDASFFMEAGRPYLLRFRSDTSQVQGAVSLSIDTANITSPTAGGQDISVFTVDSVPDDAEVGDLVIFGEVGTDVISCKVLEIQPKDDLKASISLTLEAPAVYTAMEGSIGPYVPIISVISDPSAIIPPIPNIILIASEGFIGIPQADGTLVLKVVISYQLDLIPSGYGGALWVQVAYREFDNQDGEDGVAGSLKFTEWVPHDQGSVIITNLADNKLHQFFIRSKTTFGAASLFSFAKEHLVTGAPSASVETVDLFTISSVPEGVLVLLDLTSVITLNASHVEITYSTTNNRDTPTPTTFNAALPADLNQLPTFEVVVPLPDDTARFFWARIFNIYGQAGPYFPTSPTAGITGSSLNRNVFFNDRMVTDQLSTLNQNPGMRWPANRSGVVGPASYITDDASIFPSYVDQAIREIATMPADSVSFNNTAILTNTATDYEIIAFVRAESGTVDLDLRVESFDTLALPSGKQYIGSVTHAAGMEQRDAIDTLVTAQTIGTTFEIITGIYSPTTTSKWFSPSLHNQGTGAYRIEYLVVREVFSFADASMLGRVPNGGFEDGARFWTVPAGWVPDGTLPRSGGASMKCEANGSLLSSATPAAEGQIIHTSGYIRVPNGGPGFDATLRMVVSWRDGADVEVAQSQGSTAVGGLTGPWENKSISAPVPAGLGIEFVRVLFFCSSYVSGTAHIDDVEQSLVNPVVIQSGITLLANPSFEQGLDAASVWDNTTEVEIVNDSSNAYDGLWVSKFDPTTTRVYYQLDPVTINANAWLGYEIKVKGGTTGTLAVRVKFLNAAGATVSEPTDLLHRVAAGGTDYNSAWIMVLVPGEAKEVQLGLVFLDSPTGTWYVDARIAIYVDAPTSFIRNTVLYNGDISIEDANGKPVGIRAVEGILDDDQITVTSGRAVITNTPDSPVGYGFGAIRVDTVVADRYLIVIRHKSATTASSGLTIKLHEKASFSVFESDVLSHIGHDDGTGLPTHVVEDDSTVDLEANAAMPGTTVREDRFTYTPTPGTKVATLAFHNSTSPAVAYEIESVTFEPLAIGPAIVWFEKNASDWTYLARNFDGIISDTSAGAGTITFPANPQVGWIIGIADGTATWDVNNLTIERNGEKIMNLAEDIVMNVVAVGGNGLQFIFTFTASDGWILT